MWRELQPDSEATSISALLRRHSFAFATSALKCLRESNLILVSRGCLEAISDHVRSRNTELGGLLLGAAYVPRELSSCAKGCLIMISGVLESQQYRTTSVSLAMDTEVWDRARHVLSASVQVVGWYHSHPNLGAFFSGTDRRTQHAFFSHPYSVGLVIDPIRREEAWFVGPDSERLSAEFVRSID